jgi:chromosomal replication initiation ATPase DnaA
MKLKQTIIEASAEAFQMTVETMLEKRRTRNRAFARFAAMALAREFMPFLSNRDLSEMMGLGCPTSALYGLQQAAILQQSDPAFASALQTAREAVKRNRES